MSHLIDMICYQLNKFYLGVNRKRNNEKSYIAWIESKWNKGKRKWEKFMGAK